MKLTDDDLVRYVVKAEGQSRGPFTIEGLESLVYLRKITAETHVSREGIDEFSPIKDTPLGKRLFPVEVKKTSEVDWAPPPGLPAKNVHANRTKFQLGETKFEKLNDETKGTPKVEVLEMLDDIRQKEIESGRDLPPPSRFKISRRSIDFWIVIIGGNVAILGAGITMQSTTSIMFAIGGSAIFTVGLLWIVFGVMDKY